ncbi:putative predicted protein [Rhizobium favelukesii]|uniref:Uncharacterized protein n=1 Tax=Rhizobium favelukesii TaxID=348824 RepID=W6RL42_9HYPH|nr:putative predicted protein [Rhizobium favelukesii]
MSSGRLGAASASVSAKMTTGQNGAQFEKIPPTAHYQATSAAALARTFWTIATLKPTLFAIERKLWPAARRAHMSLAISGVTDFGRPPVRPSAFARAIPSICRSSRISVSIPRLAPGYP